MHLLSLNVRFDQFVGKIRRLLGNSRQPDHLAILILAMAIIENVFVNDSDSVVSVFNRLTTIDATHFTLDSVNAAKKELLWCIASNRRQQLFCVYQVLPNSLVNHSHREYPLALILKVAVLRKAFPPKQRFPRLL